MNFVDEEELVLAERQSEVDRAESNILQVLGQKNAPFPPAELITELERGGFRNADIRAAIWYLLDRHKLDLTLDLKLVLARSSL
ncbi:MAG TPA: hypothetical protein VNZ55_05720 [Thermomicrobiales bacterium]|nr:hypothetical protein [Thermomicrobiales bacterium]